MLTKSELTMRVQIADSNKVWLDTNASVLVKLFEAPNALYLDLLKAEVELMKVAKQQRVLVDKLIEWLKNQEVQE